MTKTRTADVRTHSALATAIAIATGTLAYGDPVRFENDGSFDWGDNLFLDITKGVSKQVGAPPAPGTFLYYQFSSPYTQGPSRRVRGGITTAEIEGDLLVTVRDAGATVPHDFVSPYGQVWSYRQTLGYYYTGGFRTDFDGGFPGDPGYIAARFVLDGQTHYGWISMQLDVMPGTVTIIFELLAWGYETEPNTPIEAGAVPSPSGALALLAFGAAAGATRARREQQG